MHGLQLSPPGLQFATVASRKDHRYDVKMRPPDSEQVPCCSPQGPPLLGLSCVADANPPPFIVKYHGRHPLVSTMYKSMDVTLG